MISLLCPHCGAPLTPEAHSLTCKNGHCHDLARSGYVNLLPITAKRSKLPGDNKAMASARRDFLGKGYYAPLSDAVNRRCTELLAGIPSPVLLDAGCGEGYYTARLFGALEPSAPDIIGLDISKFALEIAAKRNKNIRFAVASVFHMPVPDSSFDLALNLFAPYAGEEYRRVLKPGGLLVLVVPGERHLWEMKEAVYPHPYPNEVKDPALEGFTLLSQERVETALRLPDSADIQSLFAMTPYTYRTSPQDKARLDALTSLKVRAEFELLCYRLT